MVGSNDKVMTRSWMSFDKALFIRWRLLPALLIVAVFAIIGAASLAALLFYGESSSWAEYLSNTYLWRIVRFSLWQAFLSSIISIGFAVPIASALMHRQFFGRDALFQLFAVSMVVPSIVAILGIVVVYGRAGWISRWTGIDVPLYGLLGILLAHIFFNLPLAVRLLVQAYSLIPQGQWRLAYQLGFSRWYAFKYIEWHYVRKALPGAFVLIFMLCFSSFAVVLSLGGGPRSSTLEVAIYQALRFEFDVSKASVLSLLQVVICSLVAVLVYRFSLPVKQDGSVLKLTVYDLKDTVWNKVIDFVVIVLALLLILPPFLAILEPVLSVVFWQTLKDLKMWMAVWVSLKIALPAAILSLILGLGFVFVARYARLKPSLNWLASMVEHLGSSILMVPGLVIATGLFLIFRQLGWGFEHGYWIVVWVNSMMALPFVLRALTPIFYQQEKRYQLLYSSLGIWGVSRFKLEWPLVRGSVAQAFGYATLLCLGDMGVIALFGSSGLLSLPLYLFQLIGSYRLEQGASVAVVLMALCVALFILSTRLIGGKQSVKN
ncbi:thiamine/thiamine pyrophosphate ABC transporter permease [Marinomonas sp. 15G1-11]|uniref:Thiamine transport system permease protein ThiP n=1 Tax=Marinomonas phaeophyticola TaxID=3004091 RepID=A0ABT4JYG6_9GAMM|nr:thiamine/thiamine pyrophosphate ABC transporter permease [Marinomonas sp. 15G1-11]MCZ2723270.1 thiamine/thiamine pyrophosphate ABC transporter permease [Marinomonas sp. 15G1-11]